MQRRISLPLNPLRSFAVASRHKTFTAAAQELGVSQVAISRQIAILEDFLDVSLFERGVRSAKLTEVGRAFGLEIAGLFDDLERATQRMISRETEGTVNLRVHPTVAHHWLMPKLLDFTARYPDIRVRFDTRVEPLDFRGTHLDVALQLGSGDWRDTRSRKLWDEQVDVVCNQAYLDKIGGISKPEDVTKGELLHSRYRRRAWEFWAKAVGVDIDVNSGTDFETSLLSFSAAEQGFGLAIGQLGLLDDIIAEGRLVRPLGMRIPTGASFYIIWPSTVSVSVKTKRFVDWLLYQVGQPHQFFAAVSDAEP
ncbi:MULTISPECIES: LysR substrate-binding domain-containing protein [Roseinatronobacter]|uniref:LysR substrate-binding domain-containing protein n=1 Tax=Roseinatronobacter domitianus TaxID=2940293 RepID=A0ABT0M507_9RHOB|nr:MULTISPECIES: LysR substrate-binding domain-containing protein [Roseibaca]MCL1629943.1 LysR substrate-binding domain-containing protein [Roseibaca domitiana]